MEKFTISKEHMVIGIFTALFVLPIFAQSQTGSFTFTLAGSARTSAGVYKKDSTLVRTLWANRTYAAGSYTEYWDGKDDYGNSITSPDKTYTIKVLSNNVKYNWDGIIGNTSSSQTGSSIHKSVYTSMTGMAIAGTNAYFCQGYSEGLPTEAKFSTTNPQVRLEIFSGTTMNADYVATDGINVYWAGYDAFSANTGWVHATKVSDDSQVSFGSNGSSYYPTYSSLKYISVIDKVVATNSRPTGLAVQQQGTYLFVSHGGLNELHVLNKTSGALVQKISVTNPRSLCVDGNSLWMVSGTNTVAKYTINSNGTLGTKTVTLSGISAPGAMQVYGSSLAVIDAGNNQLVRFFNTATGAQGTSLGTPGGYANSPNVTNTKFHFHDLTTNGNTYSFLAFAPDGSFWVGDPGNYRQLHFSSSRTYIETIQSLGATYSSCVDPNNITRVFANYLEFAVDYSKPLTGKTGWTLVRNWGWGQEANVGLSKLLNVVTLSNGRTYGYNYKTAGYSTTFVELTATGFRSITHPGGIICRDGSIQKVTGSKSLGLTVTVRKYPLTGFDASGNPQWSSTSTLLATTPANALNNPIWEPDTEVLTSTGKVMFYCPELYLNGNTSQKYTGYHLGAIKKGQTQWLWKTQRQNQTYYAGAFPEADYFEVGNNVNQYAGSRVTVMDSNVITGYHGEFWKHSQTNYYNHYLDDGLAVGQFGTDNYVSGLKPAVGNAGNALTPMVVKDGSGNLYLYHGDESVHAGIHRWKITNLNSIKEQSINMPFPSAYVPPSLGYINLHSGLPWNTTPVTKGWSITGKVNSVTGTKKYINDGAPDIYTIFDQSSGSASVARDLGQNSVTTSWKISGMVSFEECVMGTNTIPYTEVLDDAGKTLARFYFRFNYDTKVITVFGNSATIIATTGIESTLYKFQPLEIAVLNGKVTFTYANFPPVTTSIYDPAANWKKPKTLRQYFVANSPAFHMNLGFMDMRFYKDYSASFISINDVDKKTGMYTIR